MNAKEAQVIKDEYERFEGRATGEIITMLWDHANNCRYRARCILIDLGRRPRVVPHKLTREDRELMALRYQRYVSGPAVRSVEPKESLSKRLHSWLKRTGAATHMQAASALQVTPNQAKNLLTSNAHLFKFYKKIAGQSYYLAI